LCETADRENQNESIKEEVTAESKEQREQFAHLFCFKKQQTC